MNYNGDRFRVYILLLFIAGFHQTVVSQTFTKITTGELVTDVAASRSVNWIDYDRDGDLDLFVSNGKSGGEHNVLYRNDGAPAYTFTRMSSLVISQDGTPSDGSTWGDYDNDGDDDAFVVNWYGVNNLMYRNEGDGSFTQLLSGIQVTDGGYSETASWGDYNNDGFLDLYVSNSGGVLNNFLYKNLGNGSFQKITGTATVLDGGHSRGVNWVDYDNDHDLDLFVANESNENEFLYKNLLTETGIDSFTRITSGPLVTSGGSSWSGSWGDYDNDGDLDVFVANWQNQNNNLFMNVGDGSFLKHPVSFGDIVDDSGYSASSGWADVDNDGDLDLFVSNAYGGPGRDFLYINQWTQTGANTTFDRVLTGSIVNDQGYNYGFSWGDYDEDGDLDVYVARTLNEAQANAFYRNDGNGNNWLIVDLKGTVSNASAIGARVKVKSVLNGNPTWQMRVVEGQSGYCGQTLQLHFGLQTSPVADSILIEWPSGLRDTFVTVPANRHYVIAENQIIGPVKISPAQEATGQLPTTTFRWHKSLIGAPYRLQVGTDSTFTSGIIFEDSTITDTTAVVDSLPNYNLLYWRIQETRTIHKDTWSAVGAFTVGATTFDYSVREKWNIISIPVTVAHYQIPYIYPTALTSAYAFIDGVNYVEKDTLNPGSGYWIKFPSDQDFQIPGVERSPDTVAVAAGWNLVGSRGDVIPAAAIASIPEGIVSSLYYGYEQGYFPADSIEPFRGYWVMVSQPGQLILNDSVVGFTKEGVQNTRYAFNRLLIQDSYGNSQTLFFSNKEIPGQKAIEMPPKPPVGVFDARYSSGKLLATMNGKQVNDIEIEISSAAFPITIIWEMVESGSEAELVVGAEKIRIKGKGETLVSSAGQKLSLRIFQSQHKPDSYSLSQNYPNPFNPVTHFEFQIAVPGVVSLKVFDMIGREVAAVVDGKLDPGSHTVSWNAGNFPSGMYYYRLIAGNYSKTRTMVLLK